MLIADHSQLVVHEHITLFGKIGNMIPHSGKVNITVILDLSESVMDIGVMRAAMAAMHRTVGFVRQVIIIADPQRQVLVFDAFSHQSFFKLKGASTLQEAKHIVKKGSVSTSFFSLPNFVWRTAQ